MVERSNLDSFEAHEFRQATGATERQLEDLAAFRNQLESWGRHMNLAGPSVSKDFWRRHVYDSAQLLQFEPRARIWADIGSGAGFPGVVIAILLKDVPGSEIHLVESTAKRAGFLNSIVQDLGLPALVHEARAERLAVPAGLEIVTARACAPLSRLLGYCRTFLEAGAQGLFLKGREAESELTEARRSWRVVAELQQSLSDPSGRVVRIRSLSRA